MPVKITIIPLESQAEAKLAYVQKLGAEHVCAIGNGRNDRKMLAAAAVGVALFSAKEVPAKPSRLRRRSCAHRRAFGRCWTCCGGPRV